MKQTLEQIVDHLALNGFFLEEVIEILEKRFIEVAMERADGNRCEAAKKLGIHRNTLQRKLSRYRIGEADVKRKPAGSAGRSRAKFTKAAMA